MKCRFDFAEMNKDDKHTVVSEPPVNVKCVCARARAWFVCVCTCVCMCSGSAVRCPPSVVLKSAHRPAYCFTIAAMQETTKKPSSRTIVLEISQMGACLLSNLSTEN